MNEPQTEAGLRVRQWFQMYASTISQPMEVLDFDEIAAVALDRVERERRREECEAEEILARALEDEFGLFMQQTSEGWKRIARVIFSRMRARHMNIDVKDVIATGGVLHGVFISIADAVQHVDEIPDVEKVGPSDDRR